MYVCMYVCILMTYADRLRLFPTIPTHATRITYAESAQPFTQINTHYVQD